MPEFIAEQYFSRTDAAGARSAASVARQAAEQLAREGTNVELVRWIFVPEDETCMFIYEADSLECVRMAAHRGALEFEHIAQAVSEPEGGSATNADARQVPLP